MGADYDVFVSYAHDDQAAVHALVDALEQVGVRVWIDAKRIDDFSGITSAISDGLARAKALLAYYSATYPTRRACQWELTTAFLAGQHAGDPRRRVLAVNPEPAFAHIQPVELRDALLPAAPGPGSLDAETLAARIARHVKELDAPLGDVLAVRGPRWVPTQHTGSTRFVGRAADLWRLHSALTATHLGVVTGAAGPGLAQVQGMGGIGKTLLAEEYALRFGPAYPGGVLWLRAFGYDDRTLALEPAEIVAAFDTEVRAAAAELGLPVAELDPAGVRSALASWIAQQRQRCLWVVDDLPGGLGVDGFQRLLAPHPLAVTLVTTRSRVYTALASRVELDVLPDDDAYALLTHHRQPDGPGEERAARDLVTALGGHALAVEVAGAGLAEQAGLRGFADLLAALADPASGELDVLAEALMEELPTGHERSIARTLSRSLAQLEADGWLVLRLASVLAAAPIPTRLTAEVIADLPPSSPVSGEPSDAAAAAVGRVTRGLAQAKALSLAAPADAQGAWQVHALVARTIRAADPDPAQTRAAHAAAVGRLAEQLSAAADIRRHGELAELVVHARTLTAQVNNPKDAELLGWVARYDFERGAFAAAQEARQREWDAYRRLLGDEHPDTLTAKGNLASTLDLAHAQELDEQAAAIRRRGTSGQDAGSGPHGV